MTADGAAVPGCVFTAVRDIRSERPGPTRLERSGKPRPPTYGGTAESYLHFSGATTSTSSPSRRSGNCTTRRAEPPYSSAGTGSSRGRSPPNSPTLRSRRSRPAGSTRPSRAVSSPGSTSGAYLRPPPGRRTRPHGSAPDSSPSTPGTWSRWRGPPGRRPGSRHGAAAGPRFPSANTAATHLGVDCGFRSKAPRLDDAAQEGAGALLLRIAEDLLRWALL